VNLSCQNCNADIVAGSKFCSSCGTAAVDAEAIPSASEERRLVTVLFSDASGYTTMAESLDPELVRELMSLIYAKADEIVSKYGGRVDKLLGDAVLAVFGDPVAHEDDAVRAVRAALELHDAVKELAPVFEERAGHSFNMHSGINTGVVVTSGLERDSTSGPLGDMVNVAARLQSLAGTDEILVGPDTTTLLGSHVELTDLGEHELKGRREPVSVARVESLVVTTPASRRYGEFVGRNEELGVLLGAVERLKDGDSSVVTVCAEAGAGKTRLIEELRSQLGDDVRWLEGRAYPYSVDTPYASVIDLLNRVAGIDENDSVDAVKSKLRAMINGVLPGDEVAMAAIGQLYGHTQESAAIDLEAFRSVLLDSLTRLLDVVGNQGPTVLCFQDLHWVDPSTATLLTDLIEAVSAPIFALCNYRPGFELGAPGERSLQLGLLSPRQTAELLKSLLNGGEPPAGLIDWICTRADGNPFFIEEIINDLLDRELLRQAEGGWELTQDLDQDTVPPTIQGLLAARIDALAPESRRVLREASVVGREFLHRIVQSVTDKPTDLDASLAGLSAADFIRENNLDPELEYIFKHALTQEVAYEGLLLRDRQLLHERVAISIEKHLGDRIEEFVETLAYHYQRSGHISEAVTYLRRSAQRALDRYAIEEAHRHYQAAYGLLTSEGTVGVVIDEKVRDRLLLEMIIESAESYYYSANLGEYHDLLQSHHDLPAAVGNDTLTARWMGWQGMIHWLHKVEHAESIALLEDAVTLAVECGDAQAEAYALAWLPWVYFTAGRASEATAFWPRLTQLLPSITSPAVRQYAQIKGLGGATAAAAVIGDATTALAHGEDLLSIGRRTGNRRATAMGHQARIMKGWAHGDVEAAFAAAQAAVDANADPIYEEAANIWATAIAIALGTAEQGRSWYDATLPTSGGSGVTGAYYEIMAFQLDLIEGRLSRGLRGLNARRQIEQNRGFGWAVINIDLFLGIALARAATGEVESSISNAIKNPGFVMRYGFGLAKKARRALEAVLTSADKHGHRALIPLIENELAKLAIHDNRTDDAAAHLRNICQRLADFPEATLHRDASAMLEELGFSPTASTS